MRSTTNDLTFHFRPTKPAQVGLTYIKPAKKRFDNITPYRSYRLMMKICKWSRREASVQIENFNLTVQNYVLECNNIVKSFAFMTRFANEETTYPGQRYRKSIALTTFLTDLTKTKFRKNLLGGSCHHGMM